jgi:hypothetical protein
MSAGSGPPRPTGGTAAAPRWMAYLRTPPLAKFPYRRRIRIASASAPNVVQEVESILRRIRFTVEVRPPAPSAGPEAPTVILAERNVVRVSMSFARAIPLLTLIGAGAVLGIVDWLVTNQFLVLFPWVGAFAIAAFVFRLRIGGAYLSELILVEVRPMAGATPNAGPTVGTQWGAGRARSEGEMGPEHERTVVRIDPMIPLTDNVAFVVQETSRHLVRAPAPVPAQSM